MITGKGNGMRSRISARIRQIKRFLLGAVLLAFAGVFLAGCEQKQYTDAELKEQKNKAAAVVQDWLAGADPGARITSMKELNVRTEVTNHNYYLTDFITGTCSSGGKNYDFAVNTRTGELYTSREFEAFRDALCAYLMSKLSLPAEGFAVSMHTARPLSVSGEHPEYGVYPFQNMLPAVIPDMDAYVREAAEGEDMSIYLQLAYIGAPLEFSESRDPAELVKPGADSVFSIYRLADGEVPEGEIDSFNMSFAPVFAAEVLRLEKGKESFARYSFDGSAEPFVLHYPKEIVMTGEDGSAGEIRRITFDGGAGGVFFLEPQEPQRLAVHTAETSETEKLYTHVILRDFDAADGIKKVLMKERSVREWYIDYYEWEPVCGSYILSAYGSPERMQDGDIVVYGGTGKTLLEEQTKANEERMKQQK